jgi:hypothetical protein
MQNNIKWFNRFGFIKLFLKCGNPLLIGYVLVLKFDFFYLKLRYVFVKFGYFRLQLSNIFLKYRFGRLERRFEKIFGVHG